MKITKNIDTKDINEERAIIRVLKSSVKPLGIIGLFLIYGGLLYLFTAKSRIMGIFYLPFLSLGLWFIFFDVIKEYKQDSSDVTNKFIILLFICFETFVLLVFVIAIISLFLN